MNRTQAEHNAIEQQIHDAAVKAMQHAAKLSDPSTVCAGIGCGRHAVCARYKALEGWDGTGVRIYTCAAPVDYPLFSPV